jgi:hypothetical protein
MMKAPRFFETSDINNPEALILKINTFATLESRTVGSVALTITTIRPTPRNKVFPNLAVLQLAKKSP